MREVLFNNSYFLVQEIMTQGLSYMPEEPEFVRDLDLKMGLLTPKPELQIPTLDSSLDYFSVTSFQSSPLRGQPWRQWELEPQIQQAWVPFLLLINNVADSRSQNRLRSVQKFIGSTTRDQVARVQSQCRPGRGAPRHAEMRDPWNTVFPVTGSGPRRLWHWLRSWGSPEEARSWRLSRNPVLKRGLSTHVCVCVLVYWHLSSSP